MTPMRIIYLEDDPADARLVRSTLTNAGLSVEVTVVENRADFLAALEERPFDVILADYRLPGFSGLEALALTRASHKDVPFIFLTGALGEERAVETLKKGATDYLLKDRLHRLAAALDRATAEAKAKTRGHQIEEALHESEERLAMAANAARVGMFDWNLSTGNMEWTVQHEVIFGYQPAAADNNRTALHSYRDWADRVHPEDLLWVEERLRRSKVERQPFTAEYRIVWPDGSVHWVVSSGQIGSAADGKSERMVGTVMETTERKLAEDALLKAKEHLEIRVNERTAELARTVKALAEEISRRVLAEESLRERSAKLEDLTTELTLTEQRERHRLAQILHDGLQQILVGAKFRLAQIQRGHTEDLQWAVGEIVELIDDAIETSRSLTAELSPPILHAGLIPALKWLGQRMHETHALTLVVTVEPPTEVVAEDAKFLLFQAVRELVFNVIKHAGVKTARVDVARRAGEIRVTVSDEGIGFDTAIMSAGSAGGFGLASITERLKLIGGRLEIESSPGGGSRVTLTVPSYDIATAAYPTAPADESSHGIGPGTDKETKLRILLADDHTVVRQGLTRMIQDASDMEIVGEATDGKHAVALAREMRPDIVLMDVSMPGMDGIEATKILHSEFPDISIIGLSMFDSKEQAAAMLEAGAVAYLSKSGPAVAVLDAIHAWGRRAGTAAKQGD